MESQSAQCENPSIHAPAIEEIAPETEKAGEERAISEEMQKRDMNKVYVSNLGNYMTQKEFASYLNEHHVEGVKSVKKQRGKTFGFVLFNSLEERETGKTLLETLTCDGKRLICKDANMQKKRGSVKREGKDRKEKEESLPENATTNDVVAPWWNVPLEEQLSRKEDEMRQMLKRCSRRIERKDKPKVKKEGQNRIGSIKKPCPDFLKGSCLYGNRCKFLHMTMEAIMESEKAKVEGAENSEEQKTVEPEDSTEQEEYQKEEEEGQLCTMLPILTGAESTGYRNKCSFTIGLNKDGEKCVGFRMGNFIKGNVCVGEVDDVVVVSPFMKRVALAVQAFVRSKEYEVYDMCKHIGFWRTLLVRYSARTDQLCVLVIVGNPYEESVPKAAEGLAKVTDAVREEIDAVMRELLAALLPQFPCLASYNYQIFTGLSNPGSDCPMTTLHGKSYIEEKLFDLTFHVSPYAFFQVNTPVAEILYRNIGDWVSLHGDTLLLDVCCGTGTIGLCLANRVKHVIGVDIEASAIEDAKHNAELNGITNCEFICSPAEKVMSELLRSEEAKKYDHIVMVVDPPRSGLHKDIIVSSRKCDAITELIYVSCNPTGSFMDNAVMLCCDPSRHNPGAAFAAMKSQPVDLFPYTEHCELMTLFGHM